jgi:transposase
LTAPFPPGKGGAEVAYGYKVKGILIHLLVDAEGLPISAVSTPANGDERKQVEHLVETVKVKMGKPGRPPKKIKRISGDKGYDSQKLRAFLLKQRNYAADSKKEKCEAKTWKTGTDECTKISRTFSWLQKKFRRLAAEPISHRLSTNNAGDSPEKRCFLRANMLKERRRIPTPKFSSEEQWIRCSRKRSAVLAC